jgi:feruloyl-CoA synthase
MTRPAAAPLRVVRLGALDAVLDRRADGTIYIRTSQALGRYHDRVSAPLDYWAKAAPDRVFLAQRDAQDYWRTYTYAQTRDAVARIGASLLRRGLSAERPIVVLSGNSIEHALLALAAMVVGIPYAPVSPAYSLMSSDFGKLRMIIDLLTPGMVFAGDTGA